MNLKYIIYISRATVHVDANSLLRMCSDFAVKNAKRNITGLLIRKGNYYFQIIEGEPETIEPLVERIALDKRHAEFQILDESPIETRIFGDWSMRAIDLERNFNLGADKRRLILDCVGRIKRNPVYDSEKVRTLLADIARVLMG